MFSAEQEAAIHRAACELVASASLGRIADYSDRTLGHTADREVAGVFVTLRNNGKLRGCFGAYGGPFSCSSALESAAVGAATRDPRFPHVTPSELGQLHLGVSVLYDIQPITAVGRSRAQSVIIGQHGLTIRHGDKTGLLLPSVAVDWKLDAEGFLRQTCKKAGLPKNAWRNEDAFLQTFQAHYFGGPFSSNA